MSHYDCLYSSEGLANCPIDTKTKGRFISPTVAGICTYATLLSTITCPDFEALQGAGLAARIAGKYNMMAPQDVRKEVIRLILLLEGTPEQAKSINQTLEGILSCSKEYILFGSDEIL